MNQFQRECKSPSQMPVCGIMVKAIAGLNRQLPAGYE